jgi:pyridoxal 5'-phosphate synthase pdxT subunit
VAVRQGSVIATAFHPELTGDLRVHALFCDLVKQNAMQQGGLAPAQPE